MSVADGARAMLRRLPTPMRRGLASLRNAAIEGVASLVGTVFTIAPVRARALVRERIDSRLSIVRPVDYAGGSVMLHVDSLVELNTRLRSCEKEPETVRWIEQYIRAGDVVFDIGANVGVYALVIDRHTRRGAKVYAFEPGAGTFLQLTRNVALNGCDGRIIPLAVAFGARTGLSTFNYSSLAPGAARHAVGESVDAFGQPFEPARRQPILVYSVDEFIETFHIEPPAHIKLDVDGTELDILRGSPRTIANPRLRSVMVELEPTTAGAHDAQRLLEGSGFRLANVTSHGDATYTSNYLFVRNGG
jgi:FkbM family methyltransferase